MPHHDTDGPPPPECQTQKCIYGGEYGEKRITWCNECVDKIKTRLLSAMQRCCYDLDDGHAHGRHVVRSRAEQKLAKGGS